MKPIQKPLDDTELENIKKQEDICLDIERCLGVLQSLLDILRKENRRWEKREIVRTSEACIVPHNIFVRLVQISGFGDEKC